MPTNGILKVANDLIARMSERNKRREEKEKEIRETVGHQDMEGEISASEEDFE